jgi:hypothetical protein
MSPYVSKRHGAMSNTKAVVLGAQAKAKKGNLIITKKGTSVHVEEIPPTGLILTWC